MNLVFIDMRLESLGDFLHFVSEGASREWDSIERQRQAGEFEEFEDYDDVSDRPFILVEFASRAVAYELNALIESELHHLANKPWADSEAYKGPNIFNELGQLIPENLKSLKLISDLPFYNVTKLVESRIGHSLNEIEGWKEIRKLRAAVNAFKHRNGFRHPRETVVSGGEVDFMQRHRINQEDAANAITVVSKFFRHLHNAVNDKPQPASTRGGVPKV